MIWWRVLQEISVLIHAYQTTDVLIICQNSANVVKTIWKVLKVDVYPSGGWMKQYNLFYIHKVLFNEHNSELIQNIKCVQFCVHELIRKAGMAWRTQKNGDFITTGYKLVI